MINILPNNQCKMINIVWIERGILLTLIYYIIKKYDNLKNKIIIIDNLKYIKLLNIFFPKLKFSIFKTHKSSNFYFNIRSIIKKQDIIIDYISNYNDIINTAKISLVPWFDMNDPLICYEYNENKKLYINNTSNFIKNFSYYKRCSYNNTFWDLYIENYIFKKYNLNIIVKDYAPSFRNINPHSASLFHINFFNNFIKSNYTNTVIEIPKVYYIQKLINQPYFNNNQSNGNGNQSNGNSNQQESSDINNINIDNEDMLNELIKLINSNFNIINKIL